MLQNFREHLQGWVIGLIITLIALGLGLFGVQNYWAGGQRSNVIVKVGSHKITEQALTLAYDRLRTQMLATGRNANLTQAMQSLLKQDILQNLIKTQAQFEYAHQSGFKLSPQQLEAALMKMSLFQVNGRFSLTKFQQFLSQLGYSQTSFLTEIQKNLLIDQAKAGLIKSAFVLKGEVEQAISLDHQSRDFNYLLIPNTRFLAQTSPSKASISAYYQKNKMRFETPAQVEIDYIEITVNDAKKDLTVTQAEAKSYFEENKSLYKEKTFAQVKKAIEKILLTEKSQQAFATLVDQLSELTYTHPNDLTFASKTLNLPIKNSQFFTQKNSNKTGITQYPKVVQAAFSENVLNNKQNSNLIQLKDNQAIVLRIKQYKPSAILPLDAVRNKIIVTLKQQMAQEKAEALGKILVSNLQKGLSIKEIMNKNQLSWKNIIQANQKNKKINKQVLEAAFSLPSSDIQRRTRHVVSLKLKDDYAVIDVKKVKAGESKALKKSEYHDFEMDLQQAYGSLAYDFYLESVLRKIKIKHSK